MISKVYLGYLCDFESIFETALARKSKPYGGKFYEKPMA
jgi:hypothetical protein